MSEDFRLRVFAAAAHTLSFKQAAQELCITQPAVSKHIRALEEHYHVRLFERLGSRLSLTTAGQVMLEHVQQLLSDYATLSYALHLFNHETAGTLRLGASTTIAQYLLPALLAAFSQTYPEIELSLINGNSRSIEQALYCHEIELGLVEGIYQSPGLNYQRLMDDELCLLAPPRLQLAAAISINELKRLPLVLREHGSGTLDVIINALQRHSIKLSELNIKLHLGSSEGIKLFLQHCDCAAIISRLAAAAELQRGELNEIKIPELNLKRRFHLVLSPGPISPLLQRFIDYIHSRCADLS